MSESTDNPTLPLTHDNIRAILAGNVQPAELLARICYQLLDEVEAEAQDCALFGKHHELAVGRMKTFREQRDAARQDAEYWKNKYEGAVMDQMADATPVAVPDAGSGEETDGEVATC